MSKKQSPAAGDQTRSFTARVLVAFEEGGHALKPNQLVIVTEAQSATLEKQGRLSTDPAGVEYCLKENPDAVILDLTGVVAEEATAPEGDGGEGTEGTEGEIVK